MNKRTTVQEAAAHVKDGTSVMASSFLERGCPCTLLAELVRQGHKDLTLIMLDSGRKTAPQYYLFENRQVKKTYLTHVAFNPYITQGMNDGTLDVELCPQGTLAERIRAGGAGLGGVLTPTGLGTLAAEGKQVIAVEGREYLLETALTADVAFVRARTADEMGNLFLHGARNFIVAMATAARYVVAEVDEIVPVGALDPDHVHVPGIFVDALVISEGNPYEQFCG